jgi:hypothetical protein
VSSNVQNLNEFHQTDSAIILFEGKESVITFIPRLISGNGIIQSPKRISLYSSESISVYVPLSILIMRSTAIDSLLAKSIAQFWNVDSNGVRVCHLDCLSNMILCVSGQREIPIY